MSGVQHATLHWLGLVVAVEGAQGGVHHHQAQEEQRAQAWIVSYSFDLKLETCLRPKEMPSADDSSITDAPGYFCSGVLASLLGC